MWGECKIIWSHFDYYSFYKLNNNNKHKFFVKVIILPFGKLYSEDESIRMRLLND